MKTDEEVIELLNQFDWNWHLVADYLNCHAEELKASFSSRQPSCDILPKAPLPFHTAHIQQENLARLQAFVSEFLLEPLPVLFDDNLTPERRSELAAAILLDMGLPYKITHHQDFKDAYAVIEDEAITLARWRDQVNYLTVLEEALFKISVRLAREEQKEDQPNEEDLDHDD